MEYTSHTDESRRDMLTAIGVERFEELLKAIPDAIRLHRPIDLPAGLSEFEVDSLLASMAGQNAVPPEITSYLGGNIYDHYIPAALEHVGSRSEFYTAYTPYQPEVAQGTLQATYEFQSMICRLTGLDVAQASLYDGGSAIAEAALLALAHTKRRGVILAGTLPPRYRTVVETYLTAQDVNITAAVAPDGTTDFDKLRSLLSDDIACVVMPSPNYFGTLDRWEDGAKLAREHGALFVAVFRPLALGITKSPGACGADIAVGEGQSLGNTPSFGGPLLGLFAAKREYIRRLPGRLVGRTVESQGRTAYVMTLQTREQHIRREKATSNICTAQALLATRAAIYMSLLGEQGFTQLAQTCMERAHYLASCIDELDGYSVPHGARFFNEFVVEGPAMASTILSRLRRHNILGGIELGMRFAGHDRRFLVCVTERHTRSDLDTFVRELRAAGEQSDGEEAQPTLMAGNSVPSLGSDS